VTGNRIPALGVRLSVGVGIGPVGLDGRWAVAAVPSASASITGPLTAVVWPHDLVSLYRTRYADMVRLAFLLTGSSAEAEEIVQEAFVRVRNRIDRVDNPSAYLRTTVVNGCRNRYRRILVERRHGAPAARASYDQVDELSDALAALPLRQRSVIVLRFYAGLTETEIAQALGCRPGTVKSLCHRGLAELRRVVEA
jgi:RNA polymerase sigma-70 factor (sigma-E family)